jgi:hypothetical protein
MWGGYTMIYSDESLYHHNHRISRNQIKDWRPYRGGVEDQQHLNREHNEQNVDLCAQICKLTDRTKR